MTQEHPITPPKHLLSHWQEVINYGYSPDRIEEMLTEAACWGADQELEACREEIIDGVGRLYVDDSKLRVCLADDIWTARRPKPPSLKEQALEALDEEHADMRIQNYKLIRSVLESLSD